jgi:hypothetical protein
LIDAECKVISSLCGSAIARTYWLVAGANSRAEKGRWRITMTGLKTFVAAALISTISATSALAQAAISEPGNFQAMYPNRDVLNGGQLTPEGRMALQQAGGAAAANNAYAAVGNAGRVGSKRHAASRAH